MIDVATIVSLLGALGIGSVIGQWFAASKDRRTARAAVLKELAAVEKARWCRDDPEADSPRLFAAIRELETAALIARVPRAAIIPYIQLATAAQWVLQEEAELRGDPEYAGLKIDMSDTVLAAAETVSKAAWSSPATRWVWLRKRLRNLDRQSAAIQDETARKKIQSARGFIR